jgi:glycerate kinase
MAEAGLILDVKLKDPEFINTIEIVMPCDVQNPLCGDRGSARVYGPQKGATPEQTNILDEQIGRLVKLFVNAIHTDQKKAEIIF